MASSFLYTTILEVCQKEYHSNDYNEFPQIVLLSYPFTRNKEKIPKEISLCLSTLKKAKADLICIASNSFHAFLPKLPKRDFVHLVNEGLKEAISQNITTALILASPLTIDSKLYETSSIDCIYPSSKNQKIINQIIREIAGGKIENSQVQKLKKIISETHAKDPFNGIIIACTELPLLHKMIPFSKTIPVINTVEILAKQLVKRALA